MTNNTNSSLSALIIGRDLKLRRIFANLGIISQIAINYEHAFLSLEEKKFDFILTVNSRPHPDLLKLMEKIEKQQVFLIGSTDTQQDFFDLSAYIQGFWRLIPDKSEKDKAADLISAIIDAYCYRAIDIYDINIEEKIKSSTVLIIDQEKESSENLDLSLAKIGFMTHVAYSSDEAIDYIQENIPGLIVATDSVNEHYIIKVKDFIREYSDQDTPIVYLAAKRSKNQMAIKLGLKIIPFEKEPLSYEKIGKILINEIKLWQAKISLKERILKDQKADNKKIARPISKVPDEKTIPKIIIKYDKPGIYIKISSSGNKENDFKESDLIEFRQQINNFVRVNIKQVNNRVQTVYFDLTLCDIESLPGKWIDYLTGFIPALKIKQEDITYAVASDKSIDKIKNHPKTKSSRILLIE